MEESNLKPHLVLLSSPGHLIPVIELGKRLVTSLNIKVTLFVASLTVTAPTESRLVEAARATNLLDIIHFPAGDITGLVEPGDKGLPTISAGVLVVKSSLRTAMSCLEPPATALIVHVYAVACLGLADELEIPRYVFVSTNAWYTAVTLYTPVLDNEVEGEFSEKEEPIVLPGCSSVRGEDLPGPMLFRTQANYREVLKIALVTLKADGVLVNTWEELEPKTLASFRDGVIKAPPIFPIGPIHSDKSPSPSSVVENEYLFNWLNKQPNESVLYISFGSAGGLSLDQTKELARGLESSNQRFIWVIRQPVENTGMSAGIFGNKTEDISSYLPEGFISSIRDRGVLIPQWGPQVEILNHPSCGGFLTHCGWKSVLEGIVNGLPMIVWPLFGDQRMNATMMTEEFGIAVRSKTLPSKGIIRRDEIEKMVKMIFSDDVGRKLRSRVKELKLGAEKALSKDGSSCNALAELLRHCQRKD